MVKSSMISLGGGPQPDLPKDLPPSATNVTQRPLSLSHNQHRRSHQILVEETRALAGEFADTGLDLLLVVVVARAVVALDR
jgi:hypothetical protein